MKKLLEVQVSVFSYFAISLFAFRHFNFRFSLFVFPFLFSPSPSTAQNSTYDLQVGLYIRTYGPIAVEEMNQFRIPASITLAQGIIESGAGQSRLAKEANNHFGIKCHSDWAGPTYHQNDEHANECFRKYSHAEESFHDHSYFLTQRDRYKGLFKLDITDYHGWAEGLATAGYATNKQYPAMLIRTIEQYQLYLYDKQGYAASDGAGGGSDFSRYAWISAFQGSGYAGDGRKIYKNNGLRCIVARGNDNIAKLSELLGVSSKKLMKYNDLKYAGSLGPGQVVYMHQKKRKAAIASHAVKAGETLYEISQRYGIKMKLLLKRNGMSEGMQPFPGQVLLLK
jgi:LysM repeat protein